MFLGWFSYLQSSHSVLYKINLTIGTLTLVTILPDSTQFSGCTEALHYLGVRRISTVIPDNFYLSQNYPNPFNPSTKIKFSTPLNPPERGTYVQLKIYDILGREIATIVNEKLQPGNYEVTWDASNFSSGLYFYQLITEGKIIDTKKMIVLK